ncbi:hypothetical protein F5Y03DRAFT_397186 [Xylaria venustula]|nr:hypothetical protein F5Y03DRAFT_397186 [Xylaria venustula]
MAVAGDFWSYQQGNWNTTKLALRCISFVLSIIIIGLSVNTSLRLLGWPAFAFYYLLDWWFALPITLIALALDFAELLSSFLRKRNPGLPPGLHIGIELVLLGGNIVALVFLGGSVPGEDYSPYEPSPVFIRPEKIATLAFIGIFTIVRFILFVTACVDTHRYQTAVQVEMIVQALRRQNINDPAAAALAHNVVYNNREPIALPEYPQIYRPSQEHYGPPEQYPVLPENQKFLGATSRESEEPILLTIEEGCGYEDISDAEDARNPHFTNIAINKGWPNTSNRLRM